MDHQIRSDVETIVDALLSAHDRLIRREIDASICGTRRDWDDMHAAQDDYEAARSLAISRLVARITDREAASGGR